MSRTDPTPDADSQGPEDTSRAFFDATTRNPRSRDIARWNTSEQSPRQIARDIGPVIYAARTPDGLIKIGYSTDVYRRISRMVGLKNLLALKPGTYADEQALHAQLKAHRHHGREYYNATDEIIAVVNEMRAAHRLAPISA